MLAFTRADRDLLRGFLGEEFDQEGPNAAGYRQQQEETNVFFDTHVACQPSGPLSLVAGFDHLFGSGRQESENFVYRVALDGVSPPASDACRSKSAPSWKTGATSAASMFSSAGLQPNAGISSWAVG